MTLSLKQKYIKTISINRTRKLKETEARDGTKHAKTVQRGGVEEGEGKGKGMFGWFESNASVDKKKAVNDGVVKVDEVNVSVVNDNDAAPITRVEQVTSPDAMADAAAATIVATLANTATAPEVNSQSRCRNTEEIKIGLTNIGITSFEKTEGKRSKLF